MDFLTQKAAEQRKKLDAQKKNGKIPVLDSQSFANVPLKAAPKLPIAKKSPMYTGRLSSGGMNLSQDEYATSVGNNHNSPWWGRTSARTSAIGHNVVGGLASAFETGQQRTKDFTANYKNRDSITAHSDEIGQLSRDRDRLLRLSRQIGKDEAEKRLRLSLSSLDEALKATKEKLAATEVDTVVDQSKVGQRLLATAAQRQQDAKQGLGKVGSFLSDATVGIGSSIPGIATSVLGAPAVGLPMLGAQAAGQKSHELSARGIGSKEAWGRGVTSGLIEIGTEAIPIGKLAKLAKGIGGKQFIKGILEQSGTEATEEAIAYTANYLADVAAKDPEAKFSARELAQSAAMGALSGGVLGGAASLGNRVLNAQPTPRLSQNRQTAAVSVAPVAQKPLGLPSPRIAVNPNGEAVVGHVANTPHLPIKQRVEKTGETVLRNADEFDFKTLSDEQVQDVNSVIKAAQRENVAPIEYMNSVAKPFDDAVEKAVISLTADLQAYTPQGVSINQEAGVRHSNNEKWYSDAFKENGRAPNKAERAEIARRMVMEDVAAQGGQYVPQDAAKGYNLAQSFREPLGKIDGDAVGVRNADETTVVDRGRVRNEVIPNYSPVNARQIVQRVQETAAQHNILQETIDRVATVASKFNVPVEYVDTLGDRVNGKYENGKITIARDTPNPVMAVFTHELTHHIESSGQYKKLAKLVEAHVKAKGGKFADDVAFIESAYAKAGVHLDAAGAPKEAVAAFVESRGLFEDEAFISRLTQENPSLARQILNWIKDAIKKIGADADTKFLVNAQRLYEKAMKETIEPKGNTATFSIDARFAGEVDAWDGKTDKTFVVGTTSDALQSIGIEARGIIWHSKKIAEILRKHEGMTRNIIKQVPDILENPIVVLKSQNRDSRVAIFGEVKDVNGSPVTAILELQPANKGGRLLSVNVVASAYGKDSNPGRFIQNSEILYLDSNIKRTESWMQGLGLKSPSDANAFGSIGSITYQDGIVKIVGVPYGQLMQNGKKDAQFSLSLDSLGNELTPEQQEFFKDSKVRDENGNLMVVYHGTGNDFTLFDKARQGENYFQGEGGFFFTSKERTAKNYAKLSDEMRGDGKVVSAYLGLTDPLVIKAPSAVRSLEFYDDHRADFLHDAMVEDKDGIIIKGVGEDLCVAFEPKQIKSIDNKTPTSSPDIRFSRSDISEYMDKYNKQYGTIKQGENPAREVEVPKKTPQGKTRKFTRTMMESEAIPDSMVGDFEEAIVNGTFAYSPMSDKAALAFADRAINDKGFNGALEHWDAVTKGKHTASKNDIVLGEVLLNQAANAGDAKLAMKLAAELAAEGTRAGQNVQALRLLKRMKPDGQLYYLQKTVQKVNADLLGKLKLKAPNVKIDEALAGELLQAKNQQEIDVATDKIYQNIADQMPASWIDKWNAWRYLSMLGNPRTHIRNIIGNGIFVPAVQLKNLIAVPMEARLPQLDRTKAVLTTKDAPLKDFARNDFANIKDAISSGGKLNPSDVIRDKQTIFKTKPLEWARKGNLNALEAEDAIFLKLHYTSAMAQVMKARGITPDYLKSGTKDANQALEDARNYAIQEAQKATFRDASKVANALNKFKRAGPAASVVGEGLFPFTKTPINILKRGVEYSPVGLVNGVKSSLYDVKNGTRTASQAIDQMASGLTGTGVLALGVWLASMGLVSGGGAEDKKESLFDKLQGMQNYALQIGDYSYTLDWAAPSSLPLFVGVELYNVSQGAEKEVSFATILDSLTKISEPMVNMSMLKGINSLFKTAAYSKSPLSDATFDTIIGYFGQGVPTLAGQVARTVDDTRRSRFVDKNSGTPEVIQKFAQTQQAKLPFASKSLNPYMDTWGREEKNGGLLGRAAQNFISPGYISKKKSAELDAEISRLYKATGDSKVLPSGADKYIRFDGETKNFTAEEYVTYASEKGQIAYKNLDDLVGSAAYRGMSDEDKAAAISSVYDYANAIAKTKVSSYVLPADMQKAKDAESKGIKPSQYFMAKTAQKNVVGDSDGHGGTIDGTTKSNKREAIDAVSGGLSDENKMLLYDSLNAGLAKKQAAGYETLKAKGMSESDFMKYLDITNNSNGLKNQNTGKTISGSLKSAQLKNLLDAGMSTAQAKYFMTVTLGSKW